MVRPMGRRFRLFLLAAGWSAMTGILFGGGFLASSVKPARAGVVYADGSPAHRLDLYVPEGKGPFPVILNIHGGGFRMGDRSMVDETIGKALLSAGYAIASVDYRLSGEAPFPAAVLDVKAAVRFLRAHAEEYGLDPSRVAAFGLSAGGNLAAMLGTTGDVAEFDDPALGHAHVSSRVQAVVDWFGPTDFGRMDGQARAQGCPPEGQRHDAPDSFESLYLGAPVPSVPDRVRRANPATYVTPDDPPFLIQNGDQDCMVPVAQSRILAEALGAGGRDVQYDLLRNVGHGDRGGAPVFQSEANIRRVLQFLAEKLKPAARPSGH